MDWFHTFNRDFIAYFDAHYPANQKLEQALRYALASPGKRLRPLFVKEVSRMIGLAEEASEIFAYAIESVHLFSLIHDDLPCLDDDDLRRGQPTLHKKFDEATALLAGDALLSFAFEAFSELAPYADPSTYGKALLFFTRTIGTSGMIGGQSRELETSSGEVEFETLLKIQAQKTSALFEAALLTPFLLKGITEEAALFIEVQKYAEVFGFAFQVADDLEDEAQDAYDSRKNIISFLGRPAAIELATQQLKQATVQAKFSATQMLLDKLAQEPRFKLT